MKFIVFFTVFAFSFCCNAKEICGEYENKIETDFQWQESDFTKESALQALSRAKAAVEGEIKLDWFELPNLNSRIEGYLLKQKGITNPSKMNIDAFCTFLAKTPVVD